MSLNFPDPSSQTPSNTFSPTSSPSASTNGLTYIYDSEKWKLSSPDVFVEKAGDTMTGDLTLPNLISEGDVQTTSLNGSQLGGFRNQIINGDFRIWQRGTNVDMSAGNASTYGADRWASAGFTSGSRMQRSGAATTQSNGVTSSIDVTNLQQLRQYVELDRANINSQFPIGSVWTQSFYTDYDIEGTSYGNLRFRITTSASSDFSTNWITAADTSGVTWQRGPGADKGTLKHYYATFTIDGDASAGVGNGADVVSLNPIFPTNPTGVSKVTYCQLEPGSVATPFEHRPIGTELALCQRYYQDLGVVYLPGVATKQTRIEQPLRPSMRADPTATFTGDNGDLINSAFRQGSMQITYIPQTTATNIFSRSITLDAEL